MDKVTRQCPQTTSFEEKGEPKRYRTEVLPLTSLPPCRWAKPALTHICSPPHLRSYPNIALELLAPFRLTLLASHPVQHCIWASVNLCLQTLTMPVTALVVFVKRNNYKLKWVIETTIPSASLKKKCFNALENLHPIGEAV